jgi:tetratricopeptide (TPR) repeat protein
VIEVIMAAGRFADALAVTEESVAAYRILSAADPARYRPELSRALTNLAAVLWALGRHSEAEQAASDADRSK